MRKFSRTSVKDKISQNSNYRLFQFLISLFVNNNILQINSINLSPFGYFYINDNLF